MKVESEKKHENERDLFLFKWNLNIFKGAFSMNFGWIYSLLAFFSSHSLVFMWIQFRSYKAANTSNTQIF